MKLALIIDKSEAYVNFQVERVLRRWKVDKAETRKVASLSDVGTVSLFGEAPTSIYNLPDTDAVKKINGELGKLSQEELKTTFAAGLIVTSSVARTSTRKLEDTFKKLGAEIFIPPGKEDDPLPIKLVSELALTKPVRELLIAYVGDDYDSLVPLVDSLSTIPKDKHHLITEEDIYIRFPQPPGAVAPWTIEKPLLAGNIEEVISIFRRVHQHSHFLVVLSTLKNKFQVAYRVAELINSNPRMTNEEIASSAGITNPRLVYFPKKLATQYGIEKLRKIAIVLAETEWQVKGGSVAPNLAIMEMMLVKVSLILGK